MWCWCKVGLLWLMDGRVWGNVIGVKRGETKLMYDKFSFSITICLQKRSISINYVPLNSSNSIIAVYKRSNFHEKLEQRANTRQKKFRTQSKFSLRGNQNMKKFQSRISFPIFPPPFLRHLHEMVAKNKWKILAASMKLGKLEKNMLNWRCQ
jgi:hypothetical protein